MTRYWIKIGLGALLVFAVGMAGYFGVRKGVGTVHTVFETSDPLSIPIKFATFRVDGAALGKLERLTLLRTAPKQVSSVEVTVRLDSASFAERLRDCIMRIDDVEKIDERTSFVCVTGDQTNAAGAFEDFGVLIVEGTDLILPLRLPSAAVQDLRNRGPAGVDSLAPTADPGNPPVATPGAMETPARP